MMKKTNRGFTLIELLVVIAIIGLLATIVAVSLTTARSRARDAKRSADLKQIQTALELYYSAEREYPESLQGLIDENYLEMGQVPEDPSNRNYEYLAGEDNNSGEILFYHLAAILENQNSDLFLNDVDQNTEESGAWPNTSWLSPPDDNLRGPCDKETGEDTGINGEDNDDTEGDADYVDSTCGITDGGGLYDVGVFPQN